MDEPTHHCRTCRHHSKEARARVVFEEGADEEELLVEHDGSAEDVARFGAKVTEDEFRCQKQGGKIIGIDDAAGAGCPLWEIGTRKPLDPHLAARLAERMRGD